MAYKYELEITVTSAKDLKNVNWRHGKLKPYTVVWVDPANKCSTRVDDEGDTCPYWDHNLVVPLSGPLEDSYLYVDIVHAGAAEDTKPLIGSTRLPLREVLDEVGFDERFSSKLELKRPSGRPQGKVEVAIIVRQPRERQQEQFYPAPAAYNYGVPPAPREYGAPPAYGSPYATAPPTGYPYGGAGYGQGSYGHEEKKSSKFGMGTGLAVGAVAGVLGGLAIAEGVDCLEDKIEDDVAERVEDDLEDDDDDDF